MIEIICRGAIDMVLVEESLFKTGNGNLVVCCTSNEDGKFVVIIE